MIFTSKRLQHPRETHSKKPGRPTEPGRSGSSSPGKEFGKRPSPNQGERVDPTRKFTGTPFKNACNIPLATPSFTANKKHAKE